MADRDRKPREKQPDDLTIQIGERRFDPIDAPAPSRRRRPQPGGAIAPRPAIDDVPGPTARAGRSGAARSSPARADGPAGGPPDTRIVQFTRPLMNQDIERLRADYGLALSAYVPNNAYVERVPAAVRRRLKNEPLIRAVVPYLPEYKVSAAVYDRERSLPASVDPGDHQLEASLFDRGSIDVVVATLEELGARDIVTVDDRPIGGLARVRFVLPVDTPVDAIAALDDVRWIEPVARIVVDNVTAAASIQSGDPAVPSVWAKGLHGEGQVIGMIDQGPPHVAHCFFADAAPNMPGAAHRKLIAVRDSAVAANDHATYVAGCAAGDDRTQVGANDHRGGAFAAKLVSGNFTGMAAGSLLTELNAAMASGAFVHTNSWHDDTNGAGNPARYTQRSADVDTFTWTNENHILLGSSGNTGNEQGPPGSAKNSVCVSAAQAAGGMMNVATGNAGPTADARRKPDLVAVGCGMESAQNGTACGTLDDGCATSWATPHAAAATALIRQYLTEGWYPTGAKVAANAMTPTGALLKAILVNATVDMTGVAGYPNDTEGWGLIRLDRALFFPGSRRQMTLWDVRHAVGPTNRETRSHTFDVAESTEQLKITLAFSDSPPAAGSFAAPVVNDLDLRVFAPDGTLYVGNDFVDGVTQPNGALVGDSLNTVETVLVNNPATGRWTIDVLAFRVAVGNPGQGYGLVATATIASGCFVAGAVYRNPDHPDVVALRAWRDRTLRPGTPGRRAMQLAVRLYRRLGPTAARAVAGHDRLRAAIRRIALAPIARRVRGRPLDTTDSWR